MPDPLTDRPDAPAPMRRRGPRPLGLHLALGSMDQPPPSPPDAAFIAGIAAYRRHPYCRALPDPPVLWQEGGSRLLDYGGAGPAVLFVPSLINRAYVLDLAPGRSMLRWLAARGVRPLLLDWGWPDPQARGLTLSGIITRRLLPAMAAAGGPVVLAGYCMGGLLTLAAAQLAPGRVAGLALLATPWDFTSLAPRVAKMLPELPVLLAGGTLSIDALQAFFALQDPGAVANKFRAFAALDPASPAAAMFVALEDWLADGIPLPALVAQECIAGWYGANTPARGEWRVEGQVIDPAALRLPAFIALPAQDRIVPPESARPLVDLLAGAEVVAPPLGHVGMVAGSRAEALLWPALLGWMRGLGAPMSGRSPEP